jgi:hypothetical protein
MISFNFHLRNPWSIKFENLWSQACATPFANKYIELEVYKDSSILALSFAWTVRQSHAGVDIELGLLGHCLHFVFFDNRHWDGVNNEYI